VQANGKGLVLDTLINVRRQVVEDFQRKVTQRFLRSLDELPGIRFGERDTQVFTGCLPERLPRGLKTVAVMGIFGKGVEVTDQPREIFISDIRLETKLVFEGDSECQDEVHCGTDIVRRDGLDKVAGYTANIQFSQEILLS
jgi:hypothetical protein